MVLHEFNMQATSHYQIPIETNSVGEGGGGEGGLEFSSEFVRKPAGVPPRPSQKDEIVDRGSEFKGQGSA